ncbi:hypothetical protein AC1031_014607 [Aphanomyces cochlioides]|nr:hypothetical protein AC1031_014607 [Aphanomyces cochlioides]
MIDNNFSDVPTELVDWDPQIISLNTNGFSNSHRVHDVSFIQETRFRTPSLHDRVAFHWQRITNHEGSLFFEEPIYPEVSTSPATGGLATLIHPHSPLKNATQVPHDNPVLRGRYLQVRCTLGPLTVVLHNIYAPAAFQQRASYFEELPRDFPPHALHIVGGDFNCTLNKDLDSLRPSTSTMAGTLQLEQWMHSLSLVDLFRRQNPVARTSLVATKTIERKMALLKAQGKPHNYKHHVNFMAQYKIHPSEILEELTTDIPEIKRILFALATIDLFLSNRAPDLYTNSEALTVLLNQEATRLPDTNCLTDWSLFALIENFSDNLEKFTLPAPVLSAISMLKSITNNYHIDELCSKAHHSMDADEIDPLDLEDDQL